MNEHADAWTMSNEANFFLLDALSQASLEDRYRTRSRTVGEQFAHMHAVRLRWLTHAAPNLAGKIEPLDLNKGLSVKNLKAALKQSGDVIGEFLDACVEAGRVPRWQGPPASFLSYLVAHEAHHRGLALVALKACGRSVPSDVVYGLWQWGKKRNLRRAKA